MPKFRFTHNEQTYVAEKISDIPNIINAMIPEAEMKNIVATIPNEDLPKIDVMGDMMPSAVKMALMERMPVPQEPPQKSMEVEQAELQSRMSALNPNSTPEQNLVSLLNNITTESSRAVTTRGGALKEISDQTKTMMNPAQRTEYKKQVMDAPLVQGVTDRSTIDNVLSRLAGQVSVDEVRNILVQNPIDPRTLTNENKRVLSNVLESLNMQDEFEFSVLREDFDTQPSGANMGGDSRLAFNQDALNEADMLLGRSSDMSRQQPTIQRAPSIQPREKIGNDPQDIYRFVLEEDWLGISKIEAPVSMLKLVVNVLLKNDILVGRFLKYISNNTYLMDNDNISYIVSEIEKTVK